MTITIGWKNSGSIILEGFRRINMRIPDEVIEFVAHKYRELQLYKTKVTFTEFLHSWLRGNGWRI